MGDRPANPDKHIENTIRRCETAGWTFSRGRKYYKGRCPCGVHLKTIHLTPNRAYLLNLRRYFTRLDCWKREDRL